MKQLISLLLLTGLAVTSCKKSSPPSSPAPPPAATNTPGLIGGGFQPGVPFSTNEFNIYDLDHDNNKDKKYFRIELYSVDSARIVMEPKPVDSLAANWPAAVKKIRWSPGAEFIVDNESYVRIAGGSFIQTPYNQTSPQHAWLSQFKYTNAPPSLPHAEVNLFGKLTLFYLGLEQPVRSVFDHQDASGNAWYSTVNLAASLGPAFDVFSYRDVTNMIYLPGRLQFFFFDFKNWQYWTVDKSNGLGQDWVGHPVKSLNKFLKWPAGWGKK